MTEKIYSAEYVHSWVQIPEMIVFCIFIIKKKKMNQKFNWILNVIIFHCFTSFKNFVLFNNLFQMNPFSIRWIKGSFILQ